MIYSRVMLDCDGVKFDFDGEDSIIFADLLQSAGVAINPHVLSFEEVISINNHLISAPLHQTVHEWSRSFNFKDALQTHVLSSDVCSLYVE